MSDLTTGVPVRLPRITIEFCVQCKWNLRAAYFAQELLQTFSTSIGEISLIPVTGGIFTISLHHKEQSSSPPPQQEEQQSETQVATNSNQQQESEPITIHETIIWDRKRDGGFPETKELKNRVRNIIEPGKDMGHVDRALKKGKKEEGKRGDEPGVAVTAGGGDEEKSSAERVVNGSQVEAGGDADGNTATVPQAQESTKKEEKDAKDSPADCEDCK